MAKRFDAKTLELIRQVQQQKTEIASAERADWRTNCSFSYTEDQSKAINLHVESDVRRLVMIAAFLNQREAAYSEMATGLEIDAPVFAWSGYSVDDWLSDIKTRINRIQIASKRKRLEALETRLNLIISPELRAEMELEAIASELK